MDSTENFVKQVQEQQASNQKSKQRNGKSHSGHKLPNKQHSTNK